MTGVRPLLLGLAAVLAHAPLVAQPVDDPILALVEQAIADGSPEEVATIVKFARKAKPDSLARIDELYADYQARIALAKKEQEAAEQEAVRQASMFQRWSGEGQIGASRATGNTSEIGLTAGLELVREGLQWSHSLNAQADYQRSDGDVTRERYLFAYEPRYDITERGFIFGLAQYEKNRFQGFDNRYSVSGGVGYRLIDRDGLTLLATTGPAYRRSDLTDGTVEKNFALRYSADLDWDISERLKLTEDANAFVSSENSTFVSITGLTAKLDDNLSARLAYRVEYETQPPLGADKTDTLTRFTLVYGF